MHTYNPLTLPDTIAEIVSKLPLEDLDNCIQINLHGIKKFVMNFIRGVKTLIQNTMIYWRN